MKIIDTFDIILIAWFCFYYFKGELLFAWWGFFILFAIQVIFQSLGEGIIKGIENKRGRRQK